MSLKRPELQSLRDEALQAAQRIGMSNPLAMRAYADLAAAADRIDAMLARATKRTVEDVPLADAEVEEVETEEEEEEYDPAALS